MSDELIFEELPPKASGRPVRPGPVWIDALRARPGEWARVPLRNASSASKYRKLHRVKLLRRTVDGEKRIYG